MTFFPGFEPSKKRTVIWLVGVGHYSVATNRLIRLNPFGLCQDLFNLPQHFAGANERRAWRQLHVDAENALVLIGDKHGGNPLREEYRSKNDDSDNRNGHDATTNKQPR